MEKSETIACHLYDYIEIACMYQLHVAATLKDGNTVKGKALNTAIRQIHGVAQECLMIDTADDKGIHYIVISKLTTLSAITENRHFDVVHF